MQQGEQILRSLDDIWAAATGHLRAHISAATYSAWFSSAQPLRFEDGIFVVGVPNHFAKEWIEDRHLDTLRRALSDATGRAVEVALEPTPTPPPEPGPSAELLHLSAVPESAPEPPDPPEFHPKYTFDSFVIGSSNRFAHAAALAVAEAPAQAYNPLFIYGGSGLGKTHLLQAIGRYVSDFHAGPTVRYVSTERFMTEFIAAVQRRHIPEFHRRYRRADLLLIDDIQFLEGKERTQEEFFHTFDALYPNSQIVITSDRPPKKISTLEERLRTRFEMGLITDIQPPDLETRLAILHKKSETDHLSVPPDVMEFIASRIQTNVRELEGALIRVAAYASLTRTEINLEVAQNVLQQLLPNSAEARVTADLVISVTSEYFDVTPDDLRSSSRSRPLVAARQMAMYLTRDLTDLSLPQIGKRFGNRDHSTVLYATNKIRQEMRERKQVYEQVKELTARIRQQASRG